MWWFIVFVIIVICWMWYEYSTAASIDSPPTNVYWDDNEVHTEQEF